jgi:hypothetical protein
MRTTLVLAAVLLPSLAFSQQSKADRVRMSVPGVQGVLQIDVGPTSWQTRLRPDGEEIQMRAMERADHLLITAFLQRVKFPASAERCRFEWWPGTEKTIRQRGVSLDDLSQTSKPGIARVDYMIPELQGAKLRMKDVHAYLGDGDLCAEIHLSKVQFNPEDGKLFEDVLATARLLPAESTSPLPQQTQSKDKDIDINAYMTEGSRFYLQRNYPAAAERYQKVLDAEKSHRTLNATWFRVLVDNLGISYGISGDLARAKETFEYGLTQDAQYPLFYYNLACTYGEMGKMDEALEQLRLSYRYKANIISGETFPDPLTDDSFRNFVKDKRFVDAVNQMRAGN